jgi:hypothetical protein
VAGAGLPSARALASTARLAPDARVSSALLEKSSDADLLREMIGFTGQRLMELEVDGLTGAGHGEHNPEQLQQGLVAIVTTSTKPEAVNAGGPALRTLR